MGQAIEKNLDDERSRWILWVPVALGCGISLYFSLFTEPSCQQVLATSLPLVVGAGVGIYNSRQWVNFLSWGLLWMVFGFALIFLRVFSINSPLLIESKGPLWIRGEICRIDHKASSQRLFQRSVLYINPWIQKRHGLPKRVLLTIRTTAMPLEKGDIIRVRALLNPLPGPCLPMGYDPRRSYFFDQIGAIGFSISEPKILKRTPHWMDQYRNKVTHTLYKGLKPPMGSLACSLITGDSAALPQWVRQAFSDSGMAHLLAISGLHISMICGICFFLFQRLLAAIPLLPLYRDIRKVSALGALGVGWIYLSISGQNYPAQRAFLMMAATLIAMMVSRRRQAMRILMLCATLFLVARPEALMSISYQLSFTAVAGLLALSQWKIRHSLYTEGHPVKAYGKDPWNPSFWKDRIRKATRKPFIYRWRRNIKSTFMSSLLITVITMPIIVYSFHFISLQGIFSNLLAIPYTGAVVMPLGLIVIALGCPGFALRVWEVALEGLLAIALFFSKNGSFLMMHFPIMTGWRFFISMMGVCWMLLWQKPWRWWGVAPFVWGFIASFGSIQNKVTFLVDTDRQLIGYIDRASHTLHVSSKRRGKFISQKWSRAYGVAKIGDLSMNSVIQLPQGKKVFIGSEMPLNGSVDFAIGQGPFPTHIRHLDTRFLKKGVYGICGCGEHILSTPHQRPWQPGYSRGPEKKSEVSHSHEEDEKS
jgi:competence protein ComEC